MVPPRSVLGLWLLVTACSGGRVAGSREGGAPDDASASTPDGGAPGIDAEVTPDTGLTTVAPCTAASCPLGCCTSAGCQPGTSPTACGLGGAACEDCVVSNQLDCTNQACSFGGCTGCAGCCDAVGACQTGDSPRACGKLGSPCANCASSGEACVSMACK